MSAAAPLERREEHAKSITRADWNRTLRLAAELARIVRDDPNATTDHAERLAELVLRLAPGD